MEKRTKGESKQPKFSLTVSERIPFGLKIKMGYLWNIKLTTKLKETYLVLSNKKRHYWFAHINLLWLGHFQPRKSFRDLKCFGLQMKYKPHGKSLDLDFLDRLQVITWLPALPCLSVPLDILIITHNGLFWAYIVFLSGARNTFLQELNCILRKWIKVDKRRTSAHIPLPASRTWATALSPQPYQKASCGFPSCCFATACKPRRLNANCSNKAFFFILCSKQMTVFVLQGCSVVDSVPFEEKQRGKYANERQKQCWCIEY